jgi:Barstar (barnase inhibitor)
MKLDRFLGPDAPCLDIVVGSASEAFDAAMALGGAGRVLRGRKMRTKGALFDEFAAVLQFPPYFGENWDTLDECLNDLEWLRTPSHVLVILDAVHTLDREDPQSLQTLRELLESVAQERARPTSSRPGGVFRVLLQCTSEQEERTRANWSLPKSTQQ